MKWITYFLSGVVASLLLVGTLLLNKGVLDGVKIEIAGLVAFPLRIYLPLFSDLKYLGIMFSIHSAGFLDGKFIQSVYFNF